MCKQHVLMWLSGALGLDALAHLLNAFGVNWTYSLDKTLSLIAFVAALVLALAFGYWAHKYDPKTSPVASKTKKR